MLRAPVWDVPIRNDLTRRGEVRRPRIREGERNFAPH